jgi:hypothetical protein
MLADLLSAIADCSTDDLARVIGAYSHEDAVWEVFHPFNTLEGAEQVRRSSGNR